MPGTLHFCADVHLGKLARLLRMLGFDTVYKNNFSKDELLKIARDDSRCVLSKSPYFLKFPDITFYQIKSSDSYQQLEEVINHFHLQQPSFNPFSRCLYCNAILEKKEKTAPTSGGRYLPVAARYRRGASQPNVLKLPAPRKRPARRVRDR